MISYTNYKDNDRSISIDIQCFVCKETKTITLTNMEYHDYFLMHRHIQDAMPNRSADFREFLISGTCPKCWNEIFNDEE